MTIKYIVMSGAAYNGIDLVGILTELYEKKYFKRADIKSVYGSSAGAIVLAIWMLDIDKDVLFDFIIRKPWNKIYTFNAGMLLELFANKGILDEKLIYEIMTPLLKSKDLSPEITLSEFFAHTKIKLTLYTTHFNDWKGVSINSTSHPDLKLIDALYMSSAMPVIFKPIIMNNELYIDGAVTKHFPIKSAIDEGCKKDEILGIKVYRPEEHSANTDTTFLQYIGSMMNNMIGALSALEDVEIPNCICHSAPRMGSEIEDVLSDPNKRKELLERGAKCAMVYLESRVKELSD
jgi:NTE family protein